MQHKILVRLCTDCNLRPLQNFSYFFRSRYSVNKLLTSRSPKKPMGGNATKEESDDGKRYFISTRFCEVVLNDAHVSEVFLLRQVQLHRILMTTLANTLPEDLHFLQWLAPPPMLSRRCSTIRFLDPFFITHFFFLLNSREDNYKSAYPQRQAIEVRQPRVVVSRGRQSLSPPPSSSPSPSHSYPSDSPSSSLSPPHSRSSPSSSASSSPSPSAYSRSGNTILEARPLLYFDEQHPPNPNTQVKSISLIAFKHLDIAGQPETPDDPLPVRLVKKAFREEIDAKKKCMKLLETLPVRMQNIKYLIRHEWYAKEIGRTDLGKGDLVFSNASHTRVLVVEVSK